MTAHTRRAWPLIALFASFVAGVLVDGWFRMNGPPRPAGQAPADVALTAAPARAAPAPSRPEPTLSPAPVATAGDTPSSRLRLPIDGVTLESLKDGFAEHRGGRPHEAVDILAPRGTPVHAVDDGTIAKLFFSKAGGTTIYQFDPGGRRCYYYAHLDRYADGLHEGQRVSKGEVIGRVGTSGNAPPGTPHLHFAVFEMNVDQKWWQGRAIDPYLVFRDGG